MQKKITLSRFGVMVMHNLISINGKPIGLSWHYHTTNAYYSTANFVKNKQKNFISSQVAFIITSVSRTSVTKKKDKHN